MEENNNYMRYTRARRRQLLDVDLNVPLPVEIQDEEVIPNNEMQVAEEGNSSRPLPIDLEAVDDDDVMISSPRAFEEASKNARRNRRRAGSSVVDVDSGASRIRRRRTTTPYQTIINCDTYINLEGDSNSPGKVNVASPPPPPPPPPPPKELVFNCPVCMGALVEEMTTKCGHIFCKQCIKSAIAMQAKCPTCRKKTTLRDIFRVYLPATQSA